MKLIKKKMTDVEITINNLVNEWVGLLKMSWSISIIKDSTQYKFRNRIEAGEFNSYGRIRTTFKWKSKFVFCTQFFICIFHRFYTICNGFSN